jgi:hypothetical protein
MGFSNLLANVRRAIGVSGSEESTIPGPSGGAGDAVPDRKATRKRPEADRSIVDWSPHHAQTFGGSGDTAAKSGKL